MGNPFGGGGGGSSGGGGGTTVSESKAAYPRQFEPLAESSVAEIQALQKVNPLAAFGSPNIFQVPGLAPFTKAGFQLAALTPFSSPAEQALPGLVNPLAMLTNQVLTGFSQPDPVQAAIMQRFVPQAAQAPSAPSSMASWPSWLSPVAASWFTSMPQATPASAFTGAPAGPLVPPLSELMAAPEALLPARAPVPMPSTAAPAAAATLSPAAAQYTPMPMDAQPGQYVGTPPPGFGSQAPVAIIAEANAYAQQAVNAANNASWEASAMTLNKDQKMRVAQQAFAEYLRNRGHFAPALLTSEVM